MRKSKQESLENRVYSHYRSLKRTCHFEWVTTSKCGWLNNCKPGTEWVFFPHSHGYRKMVTPNSTWLILARTHKLSVREVKDIVTRKRGKR